MEGGDLDIRFGTGLGRTDLHDVDLGAMHVAGGSNTVSVGSVDEDCNGRVVIASLSRDSGKNINWDFQGGGTLRVGFASPPPLVGGIIGTWATVNGGDWATVNSDNDVVPYAAYRVNPDPATWTSGDNVLNEYPRGYQRERGGRLVEDQHRSAHADRRVVLHHPRHPRRGRRQQLDQRIGPDLGRPLVGGNLRL
jgi:hypothetical protein